MSNLANRCSGEVIRSWGWSVSSSRQPIQPCSHGMSKTTGRKSIFLWITARSFNWSACVRESGAPPNFGEGCRPTRNSDFVEEISRCINAMHKPTSTPFQVKLEQELELLEGFLRRLRLSWLLHHFAHGRCGPHSFLEIALWRWRCFLSWPWFPTRLSCSHLFGPTAYVLFFTPRPHCQPEARDLWPSDRLVLRVKDLYG